MKEFMIQIGTFMLLGKTLLHFCPSGKYEKYIKFLFGFMIIIQFAGPVLALGNESVMEDYIKNQEMFEGKFKASLKQVEEKWFVYNEEIENQIEKEQQKAEQMIQEQEAEQQEETAVQRAEEEKEAETGQETDKKEEIVVDKVKIEVTGYE